MAKNKTFETTESVTDFINQLDDENKQIDSLLICRLMSEASGHEAKMWGPSIIGFGSMHYRYESGHEGDAPLIGFSPRKNAISLYLASNFDKKEELLSKFGKHKLGKGCVYVNKLKDINIEVLQEIIAASLSHTKLTNQVC
ncbi:MAG: DUF1801 domain-containing protein [Proteobacteria bacterium]|nr:MAG: DUF1801 domain-containing protein [Pseudomonadota bacterium]